MLSDDIRRRLEALNRKPLPAGAPSVSAEPATSRAAAEVALRFDPPQRHRPVCEFESTAQQICVSPCDGGEPADRKPTRARGGFALESLVPGVVHYTPSGAHYRVQRPLERFWPAARLCTDTQHAAPLASADGKRHRELEWLAAHFPRATLFLDLETCGFAGSMVFLIGLIWKRGDELVLDQLIARNYAEERAILETLWQIAACCEVLVTFNGKSFDWPMIEDRSIRHRLMTPAGNRISIVESPPADDSCDGDAAAAHDASPERYARALPHCDLLHHCRRRWKRRLPNCKLQTLERFICRRTRNGDIPGWQIPLAYHEFVRTGDAWQLKSIVEHNALDLVTLVEIVSALL